ncbi:uncharacterized protein O3C94_017035 [Discoglossus pictus]
MGKSCAAPECRRLEGRKETYYKFPLNDKARLRQWLANMKKETFVPSKNHHLCSRHFKPSCFGYQCGEQLLKQNAVPTIFHHAGNVSIRKDLSKPKQSPTTPTIIQEGLNISPLPDYKPVEDQSTSGVMDGETFAIALDPSISTGQVFIDGASGLVKGLGPLTLPNSIIGLPLVHFVQSFDDLSLAASQTQGLSSIVLPVGMIEQQTSAGPLALISAEHNTPPSLQRALGYNGVVSEMVPTLLDLSQNPGSGGTLVIENIALDPFFETDIPTMEPVQMSQEELKTYIETMQTATAVSSLQNSPLPPLMVTTETVLSPAITSPITSTIPIVSKHAQALEDESGLQGQSKLPDDLSTSQLVSVVVDLQKKVKTLQQRHRRHCYKLETMEGVVEELRKENLIPDEMLNLQVTGLQPGSEIPENANMVTIVCQEEDQTMMYAGGNQTIFVEEL